MLSQQQPLSLLSLLAPFPSKPRPVESLLNPPPAPLTGLSALLPPFGTHFDRSAIELQYKDAIASLSERLGTDRWFLGSPYVPFNTVEINIWRVNPSSFISGPTALDALVFAYLHCILHTKDNAIRVEVTRRVNLVAWEHRVRSQVRTGFRRTHRVHPLIA